MLRSGSIVDQDARTELTAAELVADGGLANIAIYHACQAIEKLLRRHPIMPVLCPMSTLCRDGARRLRAHPRRDWEIIKRLNRLAMSTRYVDAAGVLAPNA